MNNYDWIPYYEEFAEKLLEYEDNRKELIEIVYTVFDEVAVNRPKMEENNEIEDIDPFTIFSLFNQGFTQKNIMQIIRSFKKHLHIEADVPESLQGVPTLTTINSNFFDYKERRAEDAIDNLWALYKSALAYSKDSSGENKEKLVNDYNLVVKQRRMGTSKITMGLSWIAPRTFLNLNGLNQNYINTPGMLPEDIAHSLPKITGEMKAEKYFEIKEAVDEYILNEKDSAGNYPEFSHAAWEYFQEEKQSARTTVGKGLPESDAEVPHYWMYLPGPRSHKWEEFYEEGVMGIGWSEFGDLSTYQSRSEMTEFIQKQEDSKASFKNITLATWEFTNEMKIGDIIFAKKGTDKIIGWGIVESDYYYDPEVRDEFKNRRKVNWKAKGEWEHPGNVVSKTLTDLTIWPNYVEELKGLFENEMDEEIGDSIDLEIVYDAYTKTDFLNEVYLGEKQYEKLTALLANKMNIILQGPPGVGKTFMAKRLAYSIIGEKNNERVKMVQFHQSYSYEDFIEGFRPAQDGEGFEIKKGAFYDFCREAEKDIDNQYFFIIDEINRGNLSKIFGELLMLIENDKRGHQLQLLYSDDKFTVPSNVYIIGMMNTADRSLAILDYALRRRFAFYDLYPAFQSTGFKSYQNKLANDSFDSLVGTIESLNAEIVSDESLGDGFSIGHSYLCNLNEMNKNQIESIIEYEILPLIREYWFDELDKVKEWESRLRRAIR